MEVTAGWDVDKNGGFEDKHTNRQTSKRVRLGARGNEFIYARNGVSCVCLCMCACT